MFVNKSLSQTGIQQQNSSPIRFNQNPEQTQLKKQLSIIPNSLLQNKILTILKCHKIPNTSQNKKSIHKNILEIEQFTTKYNDFEFVFDNNTGFYWLNLLKIIDYDIKQKHFKDLQKLNLSLINEIGIGKALRLTTIQKFFNIRWPTLHILFLERHIVSNKYNKNHHHGLQFLNTNQNNQNIKVLIIKCDNFTQKLKYSIISNKFKQLKQLHLYIERQKQFIDLEKKDQIISELFEQFRNNQPFRIFYTTNYQKNQFDQHIITTFVNRNLLILEKPHVSDQKTAQEKSGNSTLLQITGNNIGNIPIIDQINPIKSPIDIINQEQIIKKQQNPTNTANTVEKTTGNTTQVTNGCNYSQNDIKVVNSKFVGRDQNQYITHISHNYQTKQIYLPQPQVQEYKPRKKIYKKNNNQVDYEGEQSSSSSQQEEFRQWVRQDRHQNHHNQDFQQYDEY